MTLSQDALRTWIVPMAVSLVFTVVGGAVIWGQYSQRVTALETDQRELRLHQQEEISRLGGHDTQIAVMNQKLDTIILQLAIVSGKLDSQTSGRK